MEPITHITSTNHIINMKNNCSHRTSFTSFLFALSIIGSMGAIGCSDGDDSGTIAAEQVETVKQFFDEDHDGVTNDIDMCVSTPTDESADQDGCSVSQLDVDTWVAGEFAPASDFKALCVSPRSGTNPATGLPYPDEAGTVLDENNWLRSWSNDLYLWYDEIVDRDPADYTTPEYFDLLKTFATTPSGNLRDRFHFTMDTAEWRALSQGGVSTGYGATFVIIQGTPPRQIVVAYTEPDSSATTDPANLARGATLLEIDGVDVIDGTDVDTLNAGLFPSEPDESHDFVVQDLGSAVTRSFTMVSEAATSVPVQHTGTIDTASGTVGYMLFNAHIATAEQLLVDAVNQLKTAGVTDLVLDLRYNGGGFLDIANELAYMIAGPGPTTGQTFEALQFNDKHTTVNPVSGELLTPSLFYNTTRGISAPQGVALPSLDLTRVYILTGWGTCSASESIINGLRGVDIEVIQIGSTTCGKPYGFYLFENCGTTYFSINFRGVNAKGFGDYTDGFSAENTDPIEGTPIPGCSVADDYTHALGDPAERRLAAALAYRTDGTCPEASGISQQVRSGSA
ncbi:MAG: S41 family peptidase, partial [Desulfobacterales bacterium]